LDMDLHRGMGELSPLQWVHGPITALQLDRPQPLRADQLLIVDGDKGRQVRPARQLLVEYMPREIARRSVVLGPVALGAAQLGIARDHNGVAEIHSVASSNSGARKSRWPPRPIRSKRSGSPGPRPAFIIPTFAAQD
jgi:hypothetical protein